MGVANIDRVQAEADNEQLSAWARQATINLRQDAATAIEIGYAQATDVYALPAIIGGHLTINNHIIVTLIFKGCHSEADPECAAHLAWWLQYQWPEHYRWCGGSHIEADGIAIAQYEYLGGEEDLTGEEEATLIAQVAQLKEVASGE